MKNILCFGDSNTWGCKPGVLTRFPLDVRWTGVLAGLLGEDYNIIEDGINGRTTVYDDPNALFRNGLSSLGYSLYRAKPLDLVVIMLGTNDLNFTDAEGYSQGIKMLSKQILMSEILFTGTSPVFKNKPRILLVSPIEMVPPVKPTACEESKKLVYYNEKVADELGVDWLDAAKYGVASTADGCHMEGKYHAVLAEAIAEKIREMDLQ